MTWVDLWPTVSLISWIGTPLLLMIETAVWRPLVGVPVADASAAGHHAEPPVELVGRVRGAVLVAEDEVVVVPGPASCPAFFGLPLLMGCERGCRPPGEFQRALRLGRLGVAALARRAPHVDHSLLRST